MANRDKVVTGRERQRGNYESNTCREESNACMEET